MTEELATPTELVTESEGRAIVEAYLAMVEQQSSTEPNQKYGQFDNSTTWGDFNNHSNPWERS